jgi:DNA-directed RNA polymerase specialized sigma24 family protein
MSEVAVSQDRGSERASSEERFDAFVAARGSALWRSAWLLTGDHHLAEDLVQTALAKSWPHWQRLQDEGRF